MTSKKGPVIKKVPPEGGYGWAIVFASALSNFLNFPLMHVFGLIFKDTFIQLGLTATEGALIINLNAAFGMTTGLINGVLLKVYGYRKVAVGAAFLLTVGIISTAYSTTFTHFILSYGIVTSLGMNISQAAYNLALNTYFKKKRNRAMGFAVAATGFGPILMPQFVNFLMHHYTVQGVTLILGGFCAHAFIAALLLQPIKWHYKSVVVEEEEEVMIFNNNYVAGKTEDPGFWTKLSQNLVHILDLKLLKDPVFVNIIIGLGIAIFAELNFTVLMPFMLSDFGLTTSEIAAFLSTLGVADILMRFLSPYIGDYFNKPPRLMYAFSLSLLVLIRFSLLISFNFYALLTVALGLGFGKGIRKVYMGLVIPQHVPLKQLPSAQGIEMMVNGICIIIGGPILGAIRDLTGSYVICIIIMNCVTLVTVLLWTIEYLVVVKVHKKRQCARSSDGDDADGTTLKNIIQIGGEK